MKSCIIYCFLMILVFSTCCRKQYLNTDFKNEGLSFSVSIKKSHNHVIRYSYYFNLFASTADSLWISRTESHGKSIEQKDDFSQNQSTKINQKNEDTLYSLFHSAIDNFSINSYKIDTTKNEIIIRLEILTVSSSMGITYIYTGMNECSPQITDLIKFINLLIKDEQFKIPG